MKGPLSEMIEDERGRRCKNANLDFQLTADSELLVNFITVPSSFRLSGLELIQTTLHKNTLPGMFAVGSSK